MPTETSGEGIVQIVQLLAKSYPGPTLLLQADGAIAWWNGSAEWRFGLESGSAGDFADRFESTLPSEALARARWTMFTARPVRGADAGAEMTFFAHRLPDTDTVLVAPAVDADLASLNRMTRELADERRRRDDLARTLKAETYFNRKLLARVKNNLALLGAITRYRAAQTEEERVRAELRALHQRIGAIALVHELLDHNRTVDVIDAGSLLEELASHLQSTICPPGVAIEAVSVPYTISVEGATPLVLLVSELVTALLRLGGGKAGRIDVALSLSGEGYLDLKVARPDAPGPERDPSAGEIGPEIVALIRQLDGTLSSLENGPGWMLRFRPARPRGDV